MTTNTIVIPQKHGPGILVRAIYFIFFGLWFSGIWAAIAWFLCVIIIGPVSYTHLTLPTNREV